MKLIQEAKECADQLEKQQPDNTISPLIRRLIVELEIRKHLELSQNVDSDTPQLTRVKKK